MSYFYHINLDMRDYEEEFRFRSQNYAKFVVLHKAITQKQHLCMLGNAHLDGIILFPAGQTSIWTTELRLLLW
jgi:hypothetical protein